MRFTGTDGRGGASCSRSPKSDRATQDDRHHGNKRQGNITARRTAQGEKSQHVRKHHHFLRRHQQRAPEPETSREILAQHEAEVLLTRGTELLGDSSAARHVITDRSTPDGLSKLALQTGADVIVFCSDSHTARGHIGVGNSAQRLLDGGATAIAIAPAGFAQEGQTRADRVGVVGDEGAQATAEALARSLGAELAPAGEQDTRLLVVGSRPEAELGRVSLSAASENLIEVATSPVLVVPRGKSLAFDGTSVAAA
jgi:hypothetical protein